MLSTKQSHFSPTLSGFWKNFLFLLKTDLHLPGKFILITAMKLEGNTLAGDLWFGVAPEVTEIGIRLLDRRHNERVFAVKFVVIDYITVMCLVLFLTRVA